MNFFIRKYFDSYALVSTIVYLLYFFMMKQLQNMKKKFFLKEPPLPPEESQLRNGNTPREFLQKGAEGFSELGLTSKESMYSTV